MPRAWGLDPARAYPLPVVGLAEGRSRALAAYEQARLDGLCDEGAWECALEAARRAQA